MGNSAGPADIEDECVSIEREQRVQSALCQMPGGQTQVLQKSYFQNRPRGEIAKALNLPLGKMKSRLRSALRRLPARLREQI